MSCVSRPNLCPASGDTENVLLQKILQSLNEGGDGGAVASVNGQTGVVLLTTSDIPEGTNLYFTDARAIAAASGAGLFLLKAGDTGTGPFIFTPSAANTVPLTLNNSLTGASLVPTLAVNPTWNTTGAPTALLVNATNTASGSAALLFNFQLNTVNVLDLRKDGRLVLAGRISATDISGVGQTFSSLNATTGSTPTAFIIQHNLSAGVPVAGFGVTQDWNLDSTTTVSTLAARQITNWVDPAHATRTSQQLFQQQVSGVLTTALTLTGVQALFRDGTVTAPGIAFALDTNTGIYRTSADSIVFATGGVLRGFWFTDGLTVTGGFTVPYVAKIALYTITLNDYTVDCTANTFTVTLPTAVGITGKLFVVKNSGVGTITVDPAGAELIDSLATATLVSGASITIQSTGTAWIII